MFLEIFGLAIIVFAALSHYRSGIWSALLTLWAVLMGGVVAFGFYLPLSRALFPMTDVSSTPYYWGDGLMLLLLFAVTFGVLRIASEQLLHNAMAFQALADSIGGAVIGAAAGYVMAGVLAVFAQMIPLAPGDVMGYKPFDLTSGKRQGHMTMKADDCVLGMYTGLLGGALSGPDGGLAAQYPDSKPGSAVDDILHYYFQRRFDYALVNNEETAPYGKSKGGIALQPDAEGTYSPVRRAVGTKITVKNAWMTPVLSWSGPGGSTVRLKPTDLEWMTTDGAIVDSKNIKSDHAFLVADVTFRPDTDEPHGVSLNDWHLESSFKGPDGKVMILGVPKLWGESTKVEKVENEGQAEVVPLASVAKGDKSGLLDTPGKGEIELWREAFGISNGADSMFVARNVNWTFDGSKRTASAKLVFLVPSLTRPWQYGIQCGFKPESASSRSDSKKEGIFKGRKEEIGPFKVTIDDVDRKRDLPEVKREADRGNELLVITIEISKSGSDKEPILLTSDDWWLKNIVDEKDFSGALLEKIVIEDGKPVPERKSKTVDIMATGSEPVMNEAGTEGQMLSPTWEVYFTSRTAKVDLCLVFEVPQGKPFGQYRLAVEEGLSSEAPEWYLLRNLSPMNSKSHLVDLDDDEVVNELPILLPDGSVRAFKPPEASGSEILVVTVDICPKDEKDRGYYELKVESIDLQAKKGPKAGKSIPIYGIRFKDEPAFHRPAVDEVLTVRGEKLLQVAFYVTKEREEMTFMVKGFKAMPLLGD